LAIWREWYIDFEGQLYEPSRPADARPSRQTQEPRGGHRLPRGAHASHEGPEHCATAAGSPGYGSWFAEATSEYIKFKLAEGTAKTNPITFEVIAYASWS